MEAKMSPAEVADKVIELSEQFNRYVFEHPDILDSMPDQAVLVFLDADDESFNEANAAIASQAPLPADSERVFVQLRRRVQIVEKVNWEAEIVPAPFQ